MIEGENYILNNGEQCEPQVFHEVPGVAIQSVDVSNADTHSVELPDVATHSVELPDVATHSVELSDVATHSVELPGIVAHGVELPDIATQSHEATQAAFDGAVHGESSSDEVVLDFSLDSMTDDTCK